MATIYVLRFGGVLILNATPAPPPPVNAQMIARKGNVTMDARKGTATMLSRKGTITLYGRQQ